MSTTTRDARNLWRERLLPPSRFRAWRPAGWYSSRFSAVNAASQLRRGRVELPPGRWAFRAVDRRVEVRYLGR